MRATGGVGASAVAVVVFPAVVDAAPHAALAPPDDDDDDADAGLFSFSAPSSGHAGHVSSIPM
jgi:hypothetical protein